MIGRCPDLNPGFTTQSHVMPNTHFKSYMISKLFLRHTLCFDFLIQWSSFYTFNQSLDYLEFASLVTSTTILECACSIFLRDMSKIV